MEESMGRFFLVPSTFFTRVGWYFLYIFPYHALLDGEIHDKLFPGLQFMYQVSYPIIVAYRPKATCLAFGEDNIFEPTTGLIILPCRPSGKNRITAIFWIRFYVVVMELGEKIIA
jgi:hypothetical protein